MGMNKDISVKLTADTTQASTALKNISSQVDAIARSHTGIQGVASSLAIFASGAKVALAPMRLLAQASIECSKAYIASARQSITMEASVRALGSACAVTVKDILNIADSLAEATAGDDDAIVGVEQLLLSVKTLDREGLARATEAALDMSVALGTDAKNAASSLARALTDPADNMRALRSANIQFTDSEEKQVKALQESGKLWEAQQIILGKVAESYGGIAKSIAETDVGKLDAIRNTWGDITEGLGQSILNNLSPALDWIERRLTIIKNKINDANTPIQVLKDFNQGIDITRKYSAEDIRAAQNLIQQRADELAKPLNSMWHFNHPYDVHGWMGNGSGDDWDLLHNSEEYKAWSDTVNTANRFGELARLAEVLDDAPAGQHSGASSDGQTGGSSSTTLAQTTHALDAFLESNKTLSPEIMTESLRRAVLEAGDQLNAHRGTDEESLYQDIFNARQRAYLDALYPSSAGTATSAIGNFLSSHSGMSTTMQVADIDSQLAQARELQAKGGMSDMEADSIQEVIDKLQKQKDELLGISDANEQVQSSAEKYAEAYAASTKYISQATQMLGSFFDLYNQLLSNDVDSLDKQLSDAEERWDKYFDNLERKQDTQKSSLAAMYDEGLISAEDYTSALEDLDEQYTQSQSEREAEEEELQKEADKAKEKQFNANKLNSIAQVLIQGAQATAAVWANPGWPAAIPLTVMLGAMNTAQVATIAAQKYTPMAVGGIVSSPTHAYIGEGAEAEAVMPLSHLSRMLSSQGMDATGGGVINISISMGDVYDPDQIAEQVYQGINRAQERGVLPAWSVR